MVYWAEQKQTHYFHNYMKRLVLASMAAFALAFTAAAESSAKLTDVHLCCDSCVKGAEKAVAKVEGTSVACDKDAGTVTITGGDADAVQKAVNALVKAGYYGKSADKAVKVSKKTGAKGEKVQSLDVSNVHLCCGKCVKAVNAAVKGVDGVTGCTAEKGVKTFQVTGDFKDTDVMEALQKAGLTGVVGKVE